MYVARKIFEFYYYFFTTYSISIFTFYLLLTIISIYFTNKYIKRNSFINYLHLISSRFSPGISIITPVYNEEENAITTIKSLLNLNYVDYNIIVVNDGSIDNTASKIIEVFDLKPIAVEKYLKLPVKTIKGVYKSTQKSYSKLLFIDKENGGKSDALNAGLNFSDKDYVLCTDGDCVIMEDALQKMMKPVLESSKTVIASGGVIRIANDCKINNGILTEVKLAKKFLIKAQILEYIRSFLLARMAWSKLNGLMVISGAFGLLNRKIAIKVGGYKIATIGEDMEIILRMQSYMYENKKDYEIKYIPDPLCWTEAPESLKILHRQRKRWAIGNIQSLRMHKKVFLNPKYKTLGLISYPFWLLYERYGPLIETAGILFFIIASFLGMVNWIYTISFLIATYLFAVMYSAFALVTEEATYNQYKSKGDIWKLFAVAIIEPFTYHIFLLWPILVGNIESFIKRNVKWGNMERKGLVREA